MLDCLKLYQESGALLEGHFLLASGKHSPTFLQSTTVTQHPAYTEAISQALAQLVAERLEPTSIDFVIGPAMGGVTLAYSLANALGSRALFAEKDGKGSMLVREGLTINAGERFLAVEDVMTTGGSVRKAIDAAVAKGGKCVGVCCIIDRGLAAQQGLADLAEDVARIALLTLEFPTYSPDTCPLCDAGIPLQEV